MIVPSRRRTRREQAPPHRPGASLPAGPRSASLSLFPLGRDDVLSPPAPHARDSMAGDCSVPLWQNGAASSENSPIAATALARVRAGPTIVIFRRWPAGAWTRVEKVDRTFDLTMGRQP